MNEITKNYIQELKEREDVVGIILFGSWARGNNRPGSDVDLVVIVKEGYRRCFEERDGQVFEMIFTTAKSALEFWTANRNDAAGLWEVAEILYEKDDVVSVIKKSTTEMLSSGKTLPDIHQIGQWKFDAGDQIGYAEYLYEKDPVTADMILSNKVFALTEVFFDLRGKWTPAPKQRLSKIKEESEELSALISQFWGVENNFTERVRVAREIIGVIF